MSSPHVDSAQSGKPRDDGPSLDRARLVKLGFIGAAVAASAVVCYFTWDEMWQESRLRTRLAFLIGLEIVYGIAAAAVLIGLPVLAGLLIQRRRAGAPIAGPARGLLLLTSLSIGFLACESTSTAVRAWRGGPSVGEALPAAPRPPFPRALGNVSPPRVAIPLPEKFSDSVPPDEVEIVVLGESSAAGVPYNLYLISPIGIVVNQLHREIPDKRFNLRLLAQSGSTLKKQHEALAFIQRRPDVIIVYCGHNEFSARFPADREITYYHDAARPSRWARFVDWVERASPFCGLIRTSAHACRVALPPSPGANRGLVDAPAYTQTEFDALLADFRDRMEAIVSYADRLGAITILIAPPGNDADFEPNRSFLPADTPYDDRLTFADDFETARELEDSDPIESARLYRLLLDRAPDFAETHFRLGRLAERAGAWEEAFVQYRQARDLDGLPMRCLTSFQDVYRDLAARHRAILIDGQAYFHAVGRRGLLDDELFHDGMHPSLRGQAALAQAVLRALHARRAFGWPTDSAAPLVDPAEVAEKFALDGRAWVKICHWGIMFYDKTAPARFDPSERRTKQDAFGKAADEITAGRSAASVGLANIGILLPITPPPDSNPRPNVLNSPG